jgi:DNA-binding CsgD family transcriptional regulator
MPTASDLPIARAYREGEPISVGAERLHADFPGMAFIEALVGSDRMPQARYLVAAPITCMGRSVGGFAAWTNQAITTDDLPLLSALSSALGLWLTHHRTDQATRKQARPAHLLSSRQVDILEQVALGKTNGTIGKQLGYSESTIKLELSRALLALRARDRQDAVHIARSLHLLGETEESAGVVR